MIAKNITKFYNGLCCASLCLATLLSSHASAADAPKGPGSMSMQTPACSTRASYFSERWNLCKGPTFMGGKSPGSDSYCARWVGCSGPLTVSTKINGTAGSISTPPPACASRTGYFSERWNVCKGPTFMGGKSPGSDSYCSSWMGCTGPLTVTASAPVVNGTARPMPTPPPSCESNASHFTDRWNACKAPKFVDGKSPGTDAHCANWIGCAGPLTVPAIITGNAGRPGM